MSRPTPPSPKRASLRAGIETCRRRISRGVRGWFWTTAVVDRRGITIYTRRPAFDRRIRDPLRSWWRELRIDLFWIANIILALAVGCFVAAILTSRFTQPLKYLWGGIIAVIIAVLLHYAGASMQARAEEEQRIREEEAFRRQLARETTPIEE